MNYFDFNSVAAFVQWVLAFSHYVASDPLTWAGLVAA